jgi:FkbM family methyltransferase
MAALQQAASLTAVLIGRESAAVRMLRPLYESLLDWSHKGKGIPWEINGITYRVDPHQRHRLGRTYDEAVAKFLRQRVQPGQICFDVGANVGVYVLQFAHWLGRHGHVVAFEPNPGALTVLRKHVRINGLDDQVSIVPAAIGASYGQVVLYASGADGMSRLGEPNVAIADEVCEVEVPIFTLDEYCQSTHLEPDWLLMDIEGFEIQALAGARQLIERRRHKLGMIVEMHPNLWNSADTTRTQTGALLAELALRAEPLTGQSDPLNEHGIVSLSYI